MENINEKVFSDLKIDQLGYVYRDVEKQAKILESLFKTPKFTFFEVNDHPIIYRGKDVRISMKIGNIIYFKTQIELIELIDGKCVYSEFLDEGKQGLHHIATMVQDVEPYLDYFKKNNIHVIQSGVLANLEFFYLDTEKQFGIIIELWRLLKKGRRKQK